jgi:hypothetical protein
MSLVGTNTQQSNYQITYYYDITSSYILKVGAWLFFFASLEAFSIIHPKIQQFGHILLSKLIMNKQQIFTFLTKGRCIFCIYFMEHMK